MGNISFRNNPFVAAFISRGPIDLVIGTDSGQKHQHLSSNEERRSSSSSAGTTTNHPFTGSDILREGGREEVELENGQGRGWGDLAAPELSARSRSSSSQKIGGSGSGRGFGHSHTASQSTAYTLTPTLVGGGSKSTNDFESITTPTSITLSFPPTPPIPASARQQYFDSAVHGGNMGLSHHHPHSLSPSPSTSTAIPLPPPRFSVGRGSDSPGMQFYPLPLPATSASLSDGMSKKNRTKATTLSKLRVTSGRQHHPDAEIAGTPRLSPQPLFQHAIGPGPSSIHMGSPIIASTDAEPSWNLLRKPPAHEAPYFGHFPSLDGDPERLSAGGKRTRLNSTSLPSGATGYSRLYWKSLKRSLTSGTPAPSISECSADTTHHVSIQAIERNGSTSSTKKSHKENLEKEDNLDADDIRHIRGGIEETGEVNIVVVDNPLHLDENEAPETVDEKGRSVYSSGGTDTPQPLLNKRPPTGGSDLSTESRSKSPPLGFDIPTDAHGRWDRTWWEIATPRTTAKWACRLWKGAKENIFYQRFRQFWDLSFQDETIEHHYRQQAWANSKSICLAATIFQIVAWALADAFLSKPWSKFELYAFYVFAPIVTIPCLPMAVLDFPERRPRIWQWTTFVMTWFWSLVVIFDMYLCHFYIAEKSTCGHRDFMNFFYYSTAKPVLALFTMGQNRSFAALGAVVWIAIVGSLIMPQNVAFIRAVVNFSCFQVLLLFVNYLQEKSDRRLFILRDQLKLQYRATQRAQRAEFKQSDSKKRFVSYIFHEVRVPLNTALLSVQNMTAAGVFKTVKDDIEFTALEGSLVMMRKILNDVLDFNRMDQGTFSTVKRPFSFHRCIRSLLVAARVAADAKGLNLIEDLDPHIDVISREAAVRALLDSEDAALQRKAKTNPSRIEGIVLGDEMRLRQIITNFLSNATKFTSKGNIRVVTRMISPAPFDNGVSAQVPGYLSPEPTPQNIAIRVEIHDSGVGIRPSEGRRLFTPYVQTSHGLSQGGKGTGLGLALVKNIIDCSNGRLGLSSRPGAGSVFWFELAFPIGKKAVEGSFSPPASPYPAPGALPIKEAPRRPALTRSHLTPKVPEFSTVSEPAPESPNPTAASTSEDNTYCFGAMTESSHASTELAYVPILSAPVVEGPGLTHLPLHHPPTLTTPMATILFPEQTDKSLACTPILSDSEDSASDAAVTPVHSPVDGQSPALDSTPQKYKALVVDDDLVTRTLMKRMLNRLGLDVDLAENGQVALEKLLGTATACGPGSHPPQEPPQGGKQYLVVFLDNSMPYRSGVEVVTWLRAASRGDFVVGVTGNALQEDQELYLRAGVNKVLTKPVMEKQIKQVLAVAKSRQISQPISPNPLLPPHL